MRPLCDDELINNPTIRRAVLAHAAAASEPTPVRSGRGATGWMIIGFVMGVLLIILIMLISLSRLG